MLTGGVDHLALEGDGFPMLRCGGGGDGEIDEVVVFVYPHVQDGLHFHFVGLGIIGLDFLADMEGANGLFATIGGDLSVGGEATEGTACGGLYASPACYFFSTME